VAATDTLRITVDGHVASVCLARPDKRNAVNLPMFRELAGCGERLAAAGVRAVVLHGEGDAFCAGIDTALFAQADPGELARMLAPAYPGGANVFQQAACAFRDLPVPVVCAMHGAALGAGLQIALGADVRVAAPATRLSVMEVHWGLVPDMGLSVTARDVLPADRLADLVYTGRSVDAREALDLGLVTAVADDPLAWAHDWAATVAGRSPDAIRAAKQLLRDGTAQPAEAALALEARLQGALIGAPNQAEAVRARLERREPEFED